jgi:hypothetical protein
MGSVEPLRTGPGHYLALFHDDGRFFTKDAQRSSTMTLYKTFSTDGGLTWSFPEAIYGSDEVHLCEPGLIRSPDGKQMAVLLRENRRVRNSHIIFSDDEGGAWSEPREVPGALTGDRHTGKYGPDGRLFISFRDTTHESPTKGDWVGWVGTYEDLVHGREGQYRVRLKDNHKGADCAYPGVEVLPDGDVRHDHLRPLDRRTNRRTSYACGSRLTSWTRWRRTRQRRNSPVPLGRRLSPTAAFYAMRRRIRSRRFAPAWSCAWGSSWTCGARRTGI